MKTNNVGKYVVLRDLLLGEKQRLEVRLLEIQTALVDTGLGSSAPKPPPKAGTMAPVAGSIPSRSVAL